MYQYINEIKRIAKTKKIRLKALAESVGMTEVGFHQAIKNNTLKFDTVIKICEVLEVPPATLLKTEAAALRESEPDYGMDEKEMIKEVLKTVKRIEKQINKYKSG